jgi:hypothetical protein
MHKLWCAVLGLNQSTARRRALRKNMMDNRDYPSISCKPLSVRDSWPDTSWLIICVLPHVVLLADGGRRNRHRHHFRCRRSTWLDYPGSKKLSVSQ